MILYKAVAVCVKQCDQVTMESDIITGFKTAYSSFHIWKSEGYEILSARIEMIDNSNADLNVVGTMNVDVSKIM